MRKKDDALYKPTAGTKYGKVPPIPTLLANLQAGLTVADISRMYGINSGTVYRAIKKHNIDVKMFRTWKEKKADALSLMQSKVFEAAMDKIPETSFRDLMTGFNIANNAERLERGQATANVGVSALLENLAGLEEQEKKLREQLGLKEE